MNIDNHSELVNMGYVYLARKAVPYSNVECRLYEKRDVPDYVLIMRGPNVLESKTFDTRKEALDYMEGK